MPFGRTKEKILVPGPRANFELNYVYQEYMATQLGNTEMMCGWRK